MDLLKFLISKKFLLHLTLAITLLVVLIYGSLAWLKSSTNYNQRIEVPNLHRLSLQLVEQELNNLDLRYTVIDSANYNPEYPKFSVIEQTPSPGKFVKEKRKIYLVLNPSGYRKITVPNLIGQTQRNAEPKLEALGFEIGSITRIPWIAKNEVRALKHKGEELASGDKLPKTAVIDLVLGDGKQDVYEQKIDSTSLNKNSD